MIGSLLVGAGMLGSAGAKPVPMVGSLLVGAYMLGSASSPPAGPSVWLSEGAGTCEFLAPAITLGNFKADGAGTCEFALEPAASFFWAHGAGGADFIGFTDIVSGFKADGTGKLNFYTSANSWLMQGTGGATFQGKSQPAPTGFKAQGTGGARFMGAVGASEDCLTSSVPAMPRQPNFVY